ncbi:hypothetical protein [Phenylobacterium sp.]|uniref:hypothetical protein n=1 Tax=Phenylobacterium sp. TaxID=1871053 RepID=UPI00286CD3F6|nr:hypothetical protein [Phenylobacterium sp.]
MRKVAEKRLDRRRPRGWLYEIGSDGGGIGKGLERAEGHELSDPEFDASGVLLIRLLLHTALSFANCKFLDQIVRTA